MSVAVIIPTYNREALIGRAIASVQRQECSLPLKIIVVNDGSTDSTPKILKKLSTEDSRITVIHQENRGVSSARNAGIATLRKDTKYVTFLDSDDLMVNNRFFKHIQHLEHDSSIDYVIGEVAVINDFGIGQLEPRPDQKLHMVQVVTHNVASTIFRHAVFKKIGGFNTDLIAAEDLDLFLRLAEAQIPFKQDNQPCIYYVQHNGDRLTLDKKLVAKISAKAIAMSLVRRKKVPVKLLMPTFNIDPLNHWNSRN